MQTLLNVLIWVGYIGLFVYLARKGEGHDAMHTGKINFAVQALAYVATYISAVALVGFGGLSYAYGLQMLLVAAGNVWLGTWIVYRFLAWPTRLCQRNLNARTPSQLLARGHRSPALGKFLALLFAVFLGVYGFMGTFLSERCGLGSTQAGLIMMLYGVMCLVGGTVSGRIGAARGPRGVIYVGEASGLVAIAALVVVTVTGAWQPALLAAGALGFGYILTQPTLVSLSMDADRTQTGLCTGLIGLGVFAGGGVGSALGSQLVALGGYGALWIAAAVLLVAQLILGGCALAALSRRAA